MTQNRASWTTSLHRILSPTSKQVHAHAYHALSNPRAYLHPVGDIWKRLLVECVAADLYVGDDAKKREEMGEIMGEENDRRTRGGMRRRFSRLECMGLSGVIIYDIPAGRDDGDETVDTNKADDDRRLPLERQRTRLTAEDIFGDSDSDNPGMSVDELIDAVNARLVYFPAYACTSFVIGQLMSAHLYSLPFLLPAVEHEGFSVDGGAFTLLDFGDPSTFSNLDSNHNLRPIQDLSASLRPVPSPLNTWKRSPALSLARSLARARSFNRNDMDIQDVNNANNSFCDDSAPFCRPDSNDTTLFDAQEREEEEDIVEADTSTSTIESAGPRTPLPLRTQTSVLDAASLESDSDSGNSFDLDEYLGNGLGKEDASLCLDLSSDIIYVGTSMVDICLDTTNKGRKPATNQERARMPGSFSDEGDFGELRGGKKDRCGMGDDEKENRPPLVCVVL